MEVDDAGTEVRMRDEHGAIQHLRNTHPAPVYRDDAFFRQYYTVQDGQLWFGVWSWKGVVCVHKHRGDAGGIFEHPFLTDVDRELPASSIGPAYQQFFSRPGELSEQRFYEPRFVRDLDRGGAR